MIEIHVDSSPNFAGVRFWLLDRNGIDGKMYVIRFGKHHTTLDGPLLEYGELPEPSFTLASDTAQQFFKQMAELALKRGIKTESDLKLEGRLDAVSAHLEDMRRLVFKEELSIKPKGE